MAKKPTKPAEPVKGPGGDTEQKPANPGDAT